MVVRINFQHGTLQLTEDAGALSQANADLLQRWVKFDARSRSHRAPAPAYGDVMRALAREKVAFEDTARTFERRGFEIAGAPTPRDYQAASLTSWKAAGGRGVVVLPTGAGKSLVAVLAIADVGRDAIVIAPTLDLVRQWQENLERYFGIPIGVLGGGEYRYESITVSTYDSASNHLEHAGHRFGMMVFDEVHHLPSERNAFSAECCIAPYRLGLTATPERSDDAEHRYDTLDGSIVFRKDIVELSGEYLADYETIRVNVELSDDERLEYMEARAEYLGYIRAKGFRFSSPNAWADFVMRASRSREGQEALKAYRRQRALAIAAPGKLDHVERLLFEHRADRAIIFTSDNATAYEISRRYLIPVITHETKVAERKWILNALAEGTIRAVATSKVLNEGVDVPDANVAIVVSGSGSVREHVQRLGRILRRREGKHAILYELITEGTVESSTSERRRDHSAYSGAKTSTRGGGGMFDS